MPKQLVDIPLVTQLFPNAVLLADQNQGPVHQSLKCITVPVFSGVDTYQVMLHQKKLLDYTIRYAHSPDRYPYEDAIAASVPKVKQLSGIIKHYEMAMKGYPGLMDLSFLRWTKIGGDLPAFMVIDLYSKVFTIKATVSKKNRYSSDPDNEVTTLEFTPKLPPEIQEQFAFFARPLMKRIHSSLVKSESIFISSKHVGSPPHLTTKKIQKAQASGLFNNIYIIADAAEWEENREVEIWPDPIVIGETGLWHPMYGNLGRQFYFIDVYEPTELEKLAVESYQKTIPQIHF